MNNLAILFESAEILVINKPAGVPAHDHPGSLGPTIAGWVADAYPSLEHVGGEFVLNEKGDTAPRSGILHRLDRETSGVLLVAKTETVYDWYRKQFDEHTARKEYRAIVYGLVKKDSDTIARSIVRNKTDFRKWVIGQKGEGKEAITRYEVLTRFEVNDVFADNFSSLAVYPQTGRTHQIRVHLASIGNPVVGDKLYAPGRLSLPGLSRHALHAQGLTVQGTDGVEQTFEAPLPGDFLQALEALERIVVE